MSRVALVVMMTLGVGASAACQRTAPADKAKDADPASAVITGSSEGSAAGAGAVVADDKMAEEKQQDEAPAPPARTGAAVVVGGGAPGSFEFKEDVDSLCSELVSDLLEVRREPMMAARDCDSSQGVRLRTCTLINESDDGLRQIKTSDLADSIARCLGHSERAQGAAAYRSDDYEERGGRHVYQWKSNDPELPTFTLVDTGSDVHDGHHVRLAVEWPEGSIDSMAFGGPSN